VCVFPLPGPASIARACASEVTAADWEAFRFERIVEVKVEEVQVDIVADKIWC
jgi:hypothetical protein